MTMLQPRRLALALALTLTWACGPQPVEPADAATPAEPAPSVIDPALLADVLGEAVEVDGDRVSADGLLVRLAFEPLIRQTGPVQLQLMQSTGYRLLGVAEGSPLWQLGLRDGDVLTTVDGQPIIGREHELRSRWERRPSSADLGYLRGDQARTLVLRIRAGAAWRSTDTVATLVPTRSEPSLPPPDLNLAVRCNPGTPPDVLANCEIDRSAAEGLRADPSSILEQARIVPATRDGEVIGFKLYGIRASSLPAALGLQNGDLVLAVDGRSLTGMEAAMEAFTRLSRSEGGTATLTIERRGETKRLTVAVVDAAK